MKLLSVVAVLGLAASIHAACDKMDMVFLVDSSQSVTEIKFDEIKGIISKIVATRSNVGSSGTQVSLVTFNDKATVQTYLNSNSDSHQVDEAIHNLKYTPGLTNTADALTKTFNDVLTSGKGMRSDSQKVVFLISDGAYTEGTEDPSAMAKKLRDERKAVVIAIGVEGLNGPNTGAFHRQLSEITGDSTKVFDTNTYADNLSKVLNGLC